MRNFLGKIEDTLSLFPSMLNVSMWCGALGSVMEMIAFVSYFFNMQGCVWSFISLVCSVTIFSNCCVLGRLQDFYEDIFIELSKYGEIENLNVCDNLADHMVSNSCSWPNALANLVHFLANIYVESRHFHLWYVGSVWNCNPFIFFDALSDGFEVCGRQIGNVYVKFREEEHAAAALNALSGRFYAGEWFSSSILLLSG